MEELNSERIEYVRDAPLTDPKLDRLKRWPFARRIAKSIESLSDPSSIVIGVHGAWGEGKTTVLNFIERELEELSNVICVRFNPWQFQDETSLLLSFFQTLGDAVKGKAPFNMRYKIRKAFDEYGALLSSISVGVGPVKFNPGQLVKELHALSYANIEKHKQKIENILREGKKRIVIFMDDIDRMDKSEIQILFKLIKLTANFPYTVYVLALDRGMVTKALEERYPSGDFLEKIIQMPLQLPPPNTIFLLVSCLDGAKEILDNVKIQLAEEELYKFRNNFIKGLLRAIKTPRMVNRFINALAFSIPILKDEVNPVDLMLIEGMRIFYPELYNSIRDNDVIFLGTKWGIHVMDDEAKSQIKNDTSVIIEKGLERLTSDEQNAAWDLLFFLFPRLNEVFGYSSSPYDRSERDMWAKKKRATSEEYFHRYFSYAIPRGDIKDQEIDLLISTIKGIESPENIPGEDIIPSILRLIAESSASLFLRKLRRRSDGLPPKASYFLAIVIATGRAIFPDAERVYDDPVADFIYERIKSIEDNSLRCDLAKNIAQTAEPVPFVFECFKNECDRKQGNQQSPFSNEERRKLCEIMVNRIRGLTKSRPIYIQYPKYAPFLFRAWSRWNSRDEVNTYIEETLDADPRNVSDLLKSYLLRGQGESDIPLFEFSEEEYHRIEEVFEPEIIYNSILKVYPHILEPYDPHVKISSEEGTARLFIGIHDQNKASSINSQN